MNKKISLKVYKLLSMLICKLETNKVNWVLIGSLNLFLQGVDVEFHDVDICTNKKGAFRINQIFKDYVVQPFAFSKTELIKSYRGILKIDNSLDFI